MTDNQITLPVALEIAGHEAIVREAYKDSVGVWTWSIGLTNATGHDVTRYIDKPQTIEHCLAVFVWALDNYAQRVRKRFKGRRLMAHQFAAALSFEWNTGAIGRADWVDLWLDGKEKEARESMMKNWVNPPEVRGRREREAALFFDGIWSNPEGECTEYQVHPRTHIPIWSSAKKIDIKDEMAVAIHRHNAVPDEPTTGPVVVPPPVEPVEQKGVNWLLVIAIILLALFLGWYYLFVAGVK